MRHPSLRDKSSWGLFAGEYGTNHLAASAISTGNPKVGVLCCRLLKVFSDSDVGDLDGGHVSNELYDNDLDVKRITAGI